MLIRQKCFIEEHNQAGAVLQFFNVFAFPGCIVKTTTTVFYLKQN